MSKDVYYVVKYTDRYTGDVSNTSQCKDSQQSIPYFYQQSGNVVDISGLYNPSEYFYLSKSLGKNSTYLKIYYKFYFFYNRSIKGNFGYNCCNGTPNVEIINYNTVTSETTYKESGNQLIVSDTPINVIIDPNNDQSLICENTTIIKADVTVPYYFKLTNFDN